MSTVIESIMEANYVHDALGGKTLGYVSKLKTTDELASTNFMSCPCIYYLL